MPRRYHPLLVALHWLLAALILGALLMGGLVMSEMPNTDPAKIGALRNHMIVGGVIGLLTLLRLVTRARTARPAPADAGHPLLNRLAGPAHGALYLLVLAMVGSGIALSVQSGLPDAVFGTAPLPASFHDYAPRAAHGLIAALLGLTILAHLGAALYHQFLRRDGLLSRMWFGQR